MAAAVERHQQSGARGASRLASRMWHESGVAASGIRQLLQPAAACIALA
jgi:hypothetical protein